MKRYRLHWVNPGKRTSGSMNNIPAEELSARMTDAWQLAGEGEVIMSMQPEEVVEYA